MKNILNDELAVLINEYEYLKELRERCIKNIENGFHTYLLFLGACLTAFSLFKSDSSNGFHYWIPLFVMTLFLICGRYIYSNLVETHITLIFYTRMLNWTRRSIIDKGFIEKEYIFLSTDESYPHFDSIGFTEKRYSVDGTLKIIELVNSLIAGLIIPYICYGIKEDTNFYICLPLAFCVVLIVLHFHQEIVNSRHNEAEDTWKKWKTSRV